MGSAEPDSIAVPLQRAGVRRALRIGAILVGGIVLGAALLAASTLLPAARINANAGANAVYLHDEMNEVGWLGKGYLLDNYMDALMLNTAMVPETGAVESTLAGSHYAAGEGSDAKDNLIERAETGAAPNAPYIRYWHGYQVWLRAALSAMTYLQWRSANAFVLGTALVLAVYVVWRRSGALAGLALAGATALVAPSAIAPSIQYTSVAAVTLLGVIAASLMHSKLETSRFDLELFVVLGAMTAYLDLLTAPLLTLGLPLVVLIAGELHARVGESVPTRSNWPLAVRAIGAWAGAYATTWGAKWLMAELWWGGAFGDVATGFVQRAGGESAMTLADRYWAVIVNQYYHVPGAIWPTDPSPLSATLLLLALGGLGVGAWVALAAWRGVRPNLWRSAGPLLLVALLPYMWIFALAQHAEQHSYMVFRILAVAAAALFVFFWATINWAAPVGRAHGTRWRRG